MGKAAECWTDGDRDAWLAAETLKRDAASGKQSGVPDNPEVQPETVDQEAHRLVLGARNDAYGHPSEDFAKTAAIWSEIFGVPVTAKQVALAMALGVKGSRLIKDIDHRDSLVDAIGYLICLERIQRREQGLE